MALAAVLGRLLEQVQTMIQFENALDYTGLDETMSEHKCDMFNQAMQYIILANQQEKSGDRSIMQQQWIAAAQ